MQLVFLNIKKLNVFYFYEIQLSCLNMCMCVPCIFKFTLVHACLIIPRTEPGVAAHTCHSNIWEAEGGGSLQVRSQPGLVSMF